MAGELEALRGELLRIAPAQLVEQLIHVAECAGARRLLAALDGEGRIEPCGQGCGWEGPWMIDSTLWPADRERLLGSAYIAPAQAAAAEEQSRLLGFEPAGSDNATD